MKKNLFLTAVWVTALVLAGCATASVSSDYNRATDFSKIKTFAWASDQKPSGDLRFDAPELRETIQRSVDAELQAKGLQKASAGQPDVLLKSYITVAQKTESVGDPYLPSFNPRVGVTGMNTYAAQDMRTFQYEEGTFVLDMVSPASGEIQWRGSLDGMVDPNATPAKRIESAPDAVAKILKKFPPGK